MVGTPAAVVVVPSVELSVRLYLMEEPKKMIDRPYKAYAYVLDGEVVWMHRVDADMEMINAVMSSGPTIVTVPDEIKAEITQGWIYNEESNTFSNPE